MVGNGSFVFDEVFLQGLHLPFIREQNERAFRAAAGSYWAAFAESAADGSANPVLPAAFVVAIRFEFGIGLGDTYGFALEAAFEAAGGGSSYLVLNRSQLLGRLRTCAVEEPFDAEQCTQP